MSERELCLTFQSPSECEKCDTRNVVTLAVRTLPEDNLAIAFDRDAEPRCAVTVHLCRDCV